MSKLKDMMKAAPVHERRLEMRSYPLDDGRIIVEGRLRDERMVNGYNWDQSERRPGVVHHLRVRLLIGGWPITIEDAEADMPTVPNEACPETRDSVKKIIGLPIVSGFSDEVRRRLGGIEGCTHLTHLIVVMGPAALHGYWTHLSREPHPIPDRWEDFPGLNYLINTCRLWREDGPIIEMMKDKIEELKAAKADCG